jgi:hypothetical protein
MGKGLWEPVQPYRQAYVFGADLNVPHADGWNAVPEILDEMNVFDLTDLTPNHEVVVAELAVFDIPVGTGYSIRIQWFRDRDGAFLGDYLLSIPDARSYGYAGWAWYYAYSYIGYVPGEIYENGGYHAELKLLVPPAASAYYDRLLPFTITGIAQPAVPQISGFSIKSFAKVE